MGASGWVAKVAYQDDLQAALDTARRAAFEAGDYFAPWRPWAFPDGTVAFAGFSDEDWDEMLNDTDDVRLHEIIARLRRGLPPETIDDLLRFNEDTETHSVIDMYGGIAAQHEYSMVSPFDLPALERTVGTDQPDPERVEEHANDLISQIPRGQGRFVIAHTDGQPSHIYFLGVTGD